MNCIRISIAIIAVWAIISYLYGMLTAYHRRKQIQKELDIERSFRKLGGDL
jgi:hypothetical protein